MNDISVTGQDQVIHQEKMQKILIKLYKAKLQAKLAKCKFEVPKVKFLEYVVRQVGVSTDSKKILAVWN